MISINSSCVRVTVKITFDSQNFLANEMLDDIYVVTNQMDIDYELEGKSIDDA